ncbi:MAG: hypothetical protein KatS3mg050_1016 [Litorilinea sp.]|nr:MAG: hypothetical protein KatS3mg050_1016 [Litorilinea sp.]
MEATFAVEKKPEKRPTPAPQADPAPQAAKDAIVGTAVGTPLFLVQRQCATCSGDDDTLLQPALAVNEPGDVYEQEAEAVANLVMRQPAAGSTPTVRRCACGGAPRGHPPPGSGPDAECPACRARRLSLQRQAQPSGPGRAPASVLPQGGGHPLPTATRRFFEQRFGQDFSPVRIHSDSQADARARAVQARAFTAGRDIVFAAGQYAPETTTGQHLLAHELTHVVQQGGQRRRIQRDNGGTESATDAPAQPTTTTTAAAPVRAGISVSMTGIIFLPAAGSVFRAGTKARQGLEIALYRLVGGQYTEAVADELYQKATASGWGGLGGLAGEATGGEPIESFGIPLRESLLMLTWLEKTKKLQVHLSDSQRDLLRYGAFTQAAWADLTNPDVTGELQGGLPRWFDEALFRQQMASHIELLRRYIDAVTTLHADPTPANRAPAIRTLQEMLDTFSESSGVLEAIRDDDALIGHPGYQLLWPTPRPADLPEGTEPTPVKAPPDRPPNPNLASAFLSFTHSQEALVAQAYNDGSARQQLLDRFTRFMARSTLGPGEGDQQISDRPGTANAPPFPAVLSVSPPLSGPPGAPQFEASAEADYRFIMSIQFPDVFSAFQTYYYEWNYVRVPDERLGQPVDFDELNPQEPSRWDVAARRFRRAGRYAAEDVETVFSELGPFGVGATSLVAANAILRFIGTGIRLGIELLTMPSSERSIAFPGPGVYVVRNKAIPYTRDGAELVRPPSVAYHPVIVRDPVELVEDRVRQDAAVADRDFQRMQELRRLLMEPVSYADEDKMRAELDTLERSLSSVGGALEVQRERLVEYRNSLRPGSPEHRQAEQQLERLDQIIAVRAARGEGRNLTGAEPLIASFISDEGQSIRLTLEALYQGEQNGRVTYWVSDLTTPNSSQDTGVGANRAEAIMAAVEGILRGHGGYGRGYVAVQIDGQTHSRRITASLGNLFMEALENITLALSVALVVAAPFTGGATLALLLPVGAIGAIPSAYRLINRAIDDTLRFDMATVMDVVNIVGGLAGLGHAATPLRMVTLGRAFMIMGLGADGLGMLLIPVGVVAQIMELEGLPPGERSARIMEILGQAMLNVGIMAGGALAQRARQQHMEAHGRSSLPETTGRRPGEGPLPGEERVPLPETPRVPVEEGTPGSRPAPDVSTPAPHVGNPEAPPVLQATTRDGLATMKLTEQGRLVLCSSPCTFLEQLFGRELSVNESLRIEHDNIVRSLERQMRRAPQNRDQGVLWSLFERGLRLQEQLQNAQRVYRTTVEPSRVNFPGHVDTLNNLQATLAHIDPGDPQLSQSRVHHAEVLNDVARLQNQEGRIAGFEDWLQRASGPAERVATTHSRAQEPAEINATREAARDVNRLLGELYEARRLAEQYGNDPDVVIRIGQDGTVVDPLTGEARRSFDISIERRGPGGETTVERRVEVQYAGPVAGVTDLHTGIVHGAQKIAAEVAAGRAPRPAEALESTVQIEWPPAGRMRNIEYDIDGYYRVYDQREPNRVRQTGSLMQDLVYGRNGLNTPGFDPRVRQLSVIHIIDQNGRLIWRLRNSAPGRPAWYIDYVIPAESRP